MRAVAIGTGLPQVNTVTRLEVLVGFSGSYLRFP